MNKIKELRKIENKDQISSNVIYYSNEYERHGSNHIHWITFYDSSFNPIEDVNVKYANLLSGLKQIVKAENKNNIIYSAYDLKQLNESFYLVEKNKDTSGLLKAMAESFDPNKK